MLLCTRMQAQDQLLLIAKEYYNNKEYNKAVELYAKLYINTPNDKNVFETYVDCLIQTKDYKTAEKIIKSLIKKDKKDATTNLLLARLYNAQGDVKKANKVIEKVMDDNTEDESTLKATALMLSEQSYTDYAINMYELGRKKANNPYIYAEELAVLYNKKGDFDKATDGLLDLAVLQPQKVEDVKTALLKLFSQTDKVELVRKKMIKRINEQADNLIYPDILAWLFIQQKDYDNAFVQIKALDIRLAEQGLRLLNFGKVAGIEKQYSAAYLAYDYIINEVGKTSPFYNTAYASKIALVKQEFEAKPNYTTDDVNKILDQYKQYIQVNPGAKSNETILEYAQLLARYAGNPKEAITVLNDAIKGPASNFFIGKCKLDLGDYYLIDNDNWESTLLYSQVDKDFKMDILGEEARFKNAKLSYYLGDFDWAQSQLDILKASTSELIANDALNLSVLITENSALDSVKTPLQIFSRADLLIFQNKYDDAIATLDSVVKEFPEHALQDDILMAKAAIAVKQHNYEKAIDLFTKVYTIHKDDILADDAIYKAAGIQEQYLNNTEAAKNLYEKIILDFPGSSYITESRKNFRRLRGDVLN
jgi:tetratricopeptide (TPR) repeat protein